MDTFDQDPLLCPECGSRMDLELIHHPDYGTIKDFWDMLFMEVPDETTTDSSRLGMDRGPVKVRERMVQVSLPFM